MSSCNTVSLAAILKKKLELAGKALDMLPPDAQTVVKSLRTQILTALRDSLDQYLKNDVSVQNGAGLRKIDLE